MSIMKTKVIFKTNEKGQSSKNKIFSNKSISLE